MREIRGLADRALVEIAFYEAVATRPVLRDAMPKLVANDAEARILVLEDLGEARDFTDLYAGNALSSSDLESLVAGSVLAPTVDRHAVIP